MRRDVLEILSENAHVEAGYDLLRQMEKAGLIVWHEWNEEQVGGWRITMLGRVRLNTWRAEKP
jgi:DNA-binding PadR family transcriptional regulator